jgi:predicted GNAT superfamily acetyltransferase
MDLRYECLTTPLPILLQAQLTELIVNVLGNQSTEEARAELTYQQARMPLVAHLAFDSDTLVGFKIGYERKPGHFYSWLGGVLPTYRKAGIASVLMQQQHDWCRENGYHTVRTQTYNQWRNMLILNLRHGFEVVGTMQGKHGLMIILEKSLLNN